MLRDLLRLLEPGLAERLDVARAVRVNRSLIPADLQKQESDLIFRVPLRTPAAAGPEVWLYLLLEHQSKPDPLMPLRLLAAMVELWQTQVREWVDRRTPAARRRLQPVVPLVLYTGQRRWRAPLRLADLMRAPAELERFIPGWETLFLNLQRTAPEALAQWGTAVGQALRVLRAEQTSREELAGVVREALAGLEGLTDAQRGQWERVAWYLLLLVFHRRDAAEYTELGELIVGQARASRFGVHEEVERMGKTMAQVVEERARAEGEARGVRRGLETVLVSRFGPLAAEVEAALDAADLDTLDGWLRRAAQAQNLAELGILSTDPSH